jgi:hypothetical protein
LPIRYEYHAENFLSMVQLGCAIILIWDYFEIASTYTWSCGRRAKSLALAFKKKRWQNRGRWTWKSER